MLAIDDNILPYLNADLPQRHSWFAFKFLGTLFAWGRTFAFFIDTHAVAHGEHVFADNISYGVGNAVDRDGLAGLHTPEADSKS